MITLDHKLLYLDFKVFRNMWSFISLDDIVILKLLFLAVVCRLHIYGFWGLIYRALLHTKWVLKIAWITFNTNFMIYRKKKWWKTACDFKQTKRLAAYALFWTRRMLAAKLVRCKRGEFKPHFLIGRLSYTQEHTTNTQPPLSLD